MLDYAKPETVTAVVAAGDVLVLVSGSELGQRFPQHSDVITAAGAAEVNRIDYADAAAVALLDDTFAGQTIELSGDYAWNFDELASAAGTLIGKEVRFHNLTPAERLELLGSRYC